MAKYLLISDLHLSDKAPSSCTDSYCDDLFDLLAQVRTMARHLGVIGIVIAGDVFHNKAPSRTSHRVVRRFIAWCQSAGVPVFITPGNHDVRNDRQESIEDQPLGVVFESGAATRLEGWGGYDAKHQYMLFGVPWLQDWSDEAVSDALRVYREEYSAAPNADTQTDLPILACSSPSPARPSQSAPRRHALVVTHSPLYPPGKELSFEFYPAGKWAEAMGHSGFTYYGHVHEPHGTWTEGGVTFCNNGSLSRGSIHEYNLTRDIGCTLWDDETGEFQFVPLKFKPASQVFRLTENQQATDMHGRLDDFLEAAGHTELGVITAEGVIEQVRTMGLTTAEVAIVEELLAEAHHEQEGRRG